MNQDDRVARAAAAHRPSARTRRHVFEQLEDIGDVTHVRFNIYPDGGVGRLRLFGRPVP